MGVRGGVGVGDGGVQAWRAQVVWYVRGGGEICYKVGAGFLKLR